MSTPTENFRMQLEIAGHLHMLASSEQLLLGKLASRDTGWLRHTLLRRLQEVSTLVERMVTLLETER